MVWAAEIITLAQCRQGMSWGFTGLGAGTWTGECAKSCQISIHRLAGQGWEGAIT